MKEVMRLDWSQAQKEEDPLELPIEFTHQFDMYDGWIEAVDAPKDWDSVVYLGNCVEDGDMFACKDNTETSLICIYKGHLNSGKY